MKSRIFENKFWKIVPFLVIFSFTIEMTLIVTILLGLPQLLIAFIPLYLSNVLLLIKILSRKENSE
ncbi:MAG: hypothetical protein EAX96_19435 [Candidatus Lokiarchaeota archaeon]|nr:hypothetical protein [Candidatus Lokiarchaeota archaeon]